MRGYQCDREQRYEQAAEHTFAGEGQKAPKGVAHLVALCRAMMAAPVASWAILPPTADQSSKAGWAYHRPAQPQQHNCGVTHSCGGVTHGCRDGLSRTAKAHSTSTGFLQAVAMQQLLGLPAHHVSPGTDPPTDPQVHGTVVPRLPGAAYCPHGAHPLPCQPPRQAAYSQEEGNSHSRPSRLEGWTPQSQSTSWAPDLDFHRDTSRPIDCTPAHRCFHAYLCTGHYLHTLTNSTLGFSIQQENCLPHTHLLSTGLSRGFVVFSGKTRGLEQSPVGLCTVRPQFALPPHRLGGGGAGVRPGPPYPPPFGHKKKVTKNGHEIGFHKLAVLGCPQPAGAHKGVGMILESIWQVQEHVFPSETATLCQE